MTARPSGHPLKIRMNGPRGRGSPSGHLAKRYRMKTDTRSAANGLMGGVVGDDGPCPNAAEPEPLNLQRFLSTGHIWAWQVATATLKPPERRYSRGISLLLACAYGAATAFSG